MSKKVTIVDYGMGNLHSVAKKLKSCGAIVEISNSPENILNADKIVLPGVGHFGNAMRNLKELNLIEPLNEAALVKKTTVLGICLGMQLMTKSSEEGNVEGLGWFDATVHKFQFEDTLNYKVPHIGWNSINIKNEHPVMHGIKNSDLFYFVHSYFVKASEEITLNETKYKISFASAIIKDNIIGVQYHPEKSHDTGTQLIKNFIDL